MKKAGTHEGCIEQTTRLFSSQLYCKEEPRLDEHGRIRMDEFELAQEIQSFIADNWSNVDEDNLGSLTDFAGYRRAFLELHGFEVEGADYDEKVEIEVALRLEG